jgi:5-methylcytosine-specific restriction protein A
MPYAAPVHRPAGYRNADARKREADQRRGTTAQRGYDGAWQKLRKEFLSLHPYCECDEHQGKDGRVFAQVVDHRKSITEHPELRLEWDNLRAMAKVCHDRHTARTQGFAQGKRP